MHISKVSVKLEGDAMCVAQGSIDDKSSSGVVTMKKKTNMAPSRSSRMKQGTAPDRTALEARGVESDAHTPTTG